MKAVPTNIITGYLGAGKTTTILNLLKQKPANERWAILVNEFGEVGIDGNMFKEYHSEAGGVFIREVTGGCMCCTAGLSMQFALSQLMARAKPHRLLIEPTGLGHPSEVLQVLAQPHYKDTLELQRTIVIIDARVISRSTYFNDDVFSQQIDIADVLVVNKSDLYEVEELKQLNDYLQSRDGYQRPVIETRFGQIDINLLQGHSIAVTKIETMNLPNSFITDETAILEIPECGFKKFENKNGEFSSVGWLFSSDRVFDRTAVFSWLSGINAERAKAICITQDGIFAYSLADNVLSEIELDESADSRIEIILSSAQDQPKVSPENFVIN